jgi:hypothetical protein
MLTLFRLRQTDQVREVLILAVTSYKYEQPAPAFLYQQDSITI